LLLNYSSNTNYRQRKGKKVNAKPKKNNRKNKTRGQAMQETGVIEDDPDIVSSKTGLKISKGDFILAKETPFSDDYYLKETLGEGAFGVVGK